MKKDEHNFLNEIQEKINKRSGGLYYNKKLSTLKKNLSITSIAIIAVISVLFFTNHLIQTLSVEQQLHTKNTLNQKKQRRNLADYAKNTPPPEKDISKKLAVHTLKEKTTKTSINDMSSYKVNPKKIKKIVAKEKFRYLFNLTPKTKKTKEGEKIKQLLKPYDRIELKEYYLYKIPETKIKLILNQFMQFNLELKKESYRDITNYYQISIKKEILDIVNEK